MASPEDETTAGNAAEASASREDAPASASAAAEPSTGTLVGADEEDAMFTTGRRSDMTDKLTLANGTVSLVEVRAFRASIPARRFPSLRHMTDEQIATIIAKDKDARSKQPWDKTTQSSNHMDDFWCSKTAAGSQPKVRTSAGNTDGMHHSTLPSMTILSCDAYMCSEDARRTHSKRRMT